MPAPWGFTGPQFLALYGVGFTLALALALVVRVLSRHPAPGRRGKPAGTVSFDVYTVACLAGGQRRVVDTAVMALVADGQLSVSRGRMLTIRGHTAREPVQQAVLRSFAACPTVTPGLLRKRTQGAPEVRGVQEAAQQRGLLLSGRQRNTARLAGLPMALLVVTGAVRLVNGVQLGRPVGVLVLFLLVSGLAAVLLLLFPPRLSRRGSGVLKTLLSTRRTGSHVLWNQDGEDLAVPISVLDVAFMGAAGVTDPTLRSTLFGHTSSSSDSSSSGGGCGGGGCGGGSCGGGGCGGGCGG